MTFTFIAWLFFSSYFSTKPDSGLPIKSESESEVFDPFSTEDLSDTSRSFPTIGRQMPLHFTRREHEGVKSEGIKHEAIKAGIKHEGIEAGIKHERDIEETGGHQPFVAEADDEEEMETTAWRDSGIGTSLDDADRNSVFRRKFYGGKE